MRECYDIAAVRQPVIHQRLHLEPAAAPADFPLAAAGERQLMAGYGRSLASC